MTKAKIIFWDPHPRRSLLERIAWRLGFVRYVPPPAPPPPAQPICPAGDPNDVAAKIAHFAAKAIAGQIMAMNTCGVDNRYLDISIRFKAPKPGSYAEKQVTARERREKAA